MPWSKLPLNDEFSVRASKNEDNAALLFVIKGVAERDVGPTQCPLSEAPSDRFYYTRFTVTVWAKYENVLPTKRDCLWIREASETLDLKALQAIFCTWHIELS
jgi:hypothetical protein